MNPIRVAVVLAIAALAGCGGGGSTTPASTAQQQALTRAQMSFTAPAATKRVAVSVDGRRTTPLDISAPQTTTVPSTNEAVSVDCTQGTTGSSSSTGGSGSDSGYACTLVMLLPPGQHTIDVQTMDLFNTLLADLQQSIQLAADTNFFGNFFGATPSPSPSGH